MTVSSGASGQLGTLTRLGRERKQVACRLFRTDVPPTTTGSYWGVWTYIDTPTKAQSQQPLQSDMVGPGGLHVCNTPIKAQVKHQSRPTWWDPRVCTYQRYADQSPGPRPFPPDGPTPGGPARTEYADQGPVATTFPTRTGGHWGTDLCRKRTTSQYKAQGPSRPNHRPTRYRN